MMREILFRGKRKGEHGYGHPDFRNRWYTASLISGIGELRTLYHEYPELWEKLKLVDGKSYRRFRSDYSVQQLEDKFNSENRRHKRQLKFTLGTGGCDDCK